MKFKHLLNIILTIIIVAGLSSCGNVDIGEERTKYQDTYWDAFDTVISITAYCDSEEEFAEINKTAKELYTYYNRLFDIYNLYDGLNNAKLINDNAGKAPIKVDSALIDLLEYSKELCRETSGNVNVAFGAVLKHWHDVREAVDNGEDAVLPDMELLKEAAKHCNPDDIIIDRADSTVFLRDPEMSLDLGAIAKGYATELIMDKLHSDGYEGIIISAGGNTKAIGTKPANENWLVAVQNPDKTQSSYAQVLSIKDMSVVTSGTYERFFELDGIRYHHIINKDTLMPENNYLSVTIVTEDSGYADALSTAVFNMSMDDGMDFVNSKDGVEAMWILNDGSKVYSNGFDKYLSQ